MGRRNSKCKDPEVPVRLVYAVGSERTRARIVGDWVQAFSLTLSKRGSTGGYISFLSLCNK